MVLWAARSGRRRSNRWRSTDPTPSSWRTRWQIHTCTHPIYLSHHFYFPCFERLWLQDVAGWEITRLLYTWRIQLKCQEQKGLLWEPRSLKRTSTSVMWGDDSVREFSRFSFLCLLLLLVWVKMCLFLFPVVFVEGSNSHLFFLL